MNLLRLNPALTLRRRLGAVLAVLAGALACCACGLTSTFVLAPRQALEAGRIAAMPPMDAAAVAAAAPGDPVLITGTLSGNTPPRPGSRLVAYTEEVWEVTVSEGSEGDSSSRGEWDARRTVVPGLRLDLGGRAVQIEAGEAARLSGARLREEVVDGDGADEAEYAGEPLADGARRYRGLADGDQATVLGRKGAGEGVLPEQIFAGDRAAFEESQRQSAAGLLRLGLCALALAPAVLVGGLLAVLLWRR